MKRRTVLQWAASSVAWPLARIRLRGQGGTPAAPFSPAHVALLEEIAALVLPRALGPKGRAEVVQQFVRWLKNYRPGAEMDHGYGATRLRSTGPYPGAKYAADLEAIARAAEGRGGRFSSLAIDWQRDIIEGALSEAKVQRLPGRPNGGHVVADLMGFYFNSSEAQDLCYSAAIGRDTCRGLRGSERAPAKRGV